MVGCEREGRFELIPIVIVTIFVKTNDIPI